MNQASLPTPGIRNASAHTTTPQQKKKLLTEGQILPSNQPETTKKRMNKPREVYDKVSVVYDVKETEENGNVLNISIKAPKSINYAILNIHKESSCICVIKDVFPLGTTQFKRNHDCNWNANKVSKQCHIAMNLLKQDEI